MKGIYLDNSATTRPHDAVIELMDSVQRENYGNPSSPHDMGLAAEKLLGEARRRVAGLFGETPGKVIFTSGGTEANNLALRGTALRRIRHGKHLVCSSVEHPSVLNCLRTLEKEGWQLTLLPVDKEGRVDAQVAGEAVREDTVLVSIMHVNSEVGTVQPLAAIGEAVKSSNARVVFHVDAVQSFGRLPLDPKGWQADMVSGSAHKVHGPKGAGCLWAAESTLLQPLCHGGEQEEGLRPGTENVPALAGFGLAAAMAAAQPSAVAIKRYKMTFIDELKRHQAPCVTVGPHPEEGAPHIVSLAFPGLQAPALLRFLEARGVYASTGSACHSRRAGPSHVLQALGLSAELSAGVLRFSFSLYISENEARRAAFLTAEAARELAALGIASKKGRRRHHP